MYISIACRLAHAASSRTSKIWLPGNFTSTRVDHEIVAIDVSRFVASLPWEKQPGNRRQQPQRVVNDEEKKHKFLKIWVPAMVEVESLQFAVVFAHIPPNTRESKIPATLYIKAFTSPTKITRHQKRDIPKHLDVRTTCSFCKRIYPLI